MLPLLALAVVADPLLAGFASPPPEARTRAYWWWLNGNVTKASIKRDLDEMAAKGFGGAVIVDANGVEQEGSARVPHGPTFASPAWRDLYRFTMAEGRPSRLGTEPEHPERLEPRRSDGCGERRAEKARVERIHR